MYLKLGIGVPCAGHVRAILELSSLVIACKSTLLANFGFVEPMGSKFIKDFLNNLKFQNILPEAREGQPWAG